MYFIPSLSRFSTKEHRILSSIQSCFLEPVSFWRGNLVNSNNSLKPEVVKMEGATDDTSSKYIMVDSADFLLMNY
jgi:hypothetical protein